MKGFKGFPPQGRLTKIPSLFFEALLPHIDNLNELKVTLYCFWRIQQKECKIVYLTQRELLSDHAFFDSLGSCDEERHAALSDGLEQALARGTLLRARWADDELYFVNTARNQAIVEGIATGKWRPDHNSSSLPVTPSIERPNIFVLYEQNIGPLTPLIADHLRDIEEAYPPAWVEEAITIAVKRNARRLSYVEGILKRWQREGHRDGPGTPSDGSRYLSGKYRDELEH